MTIDEAKAMFLNISKTAKVDGLDINWEKVKMTSTYIKLINLLSLLEKKA